MNLHVVNSLYCQFIRSPVRTNSYSGEVQFTQLYSVNGADGGVRLPITRTCMCICCILFYFGPTVEIIYIYSFIQTLLINCESVSMIQFVFSDLAFGHILVINNMKDGET